MKPSHSSPALFYRMKIWEKYGKVAQVPGAMKTPLITACLIALLLSSNAKAEDATDKEALPLLHQSVLLFNDGKKDDARTSFEKCLQYKLSPKDESLVRGCLGSLQDDKDKSLDFLKRARELDPTNTQVLPTLGSVYAQRREYPAAKECLNAYLSASPDSPNAGPVKDLLAQIDKLEKEDALLDKLNKAVSLYNDHKYDEAVAIMEETQKIEHPHGKMEREILGLSYLRLGKYAQAIEIFKKTLEIDPKQPAIVSSLAGAYEGMGDLKQARECLKRYLHMEHSGEMAVAAKDRMPMLKKVMKTAGDVDGPDYFQAVSTPFIARWSLTRMPLRVFIESGASVKNYQPSYDASIAKALDLWCKATEGKLSWTVATDKAHSDIEVTYTADPAAVGKTESHSEAGICETHVLRQHGAKIGGIDHATIKLLTTNTHGTAFGPEEMEATVAHEIGHSLGMKSHSANPNDVMFFAATKATKEGLTERDATTIKYVYNAIVYDNGRIEVAGRQEKN
jgi:tetratricopeptide (TPR) repeat protein/predicted Zn-dependent protease